MIFREIYNSSDLESGTAFSAFTADGPVEDLAPQSELFGNLPLQQPTEKPPIFIALSGIDPISSSPVSGPGPPNSSGAKGEDIFGSPRFPILYPCHQ